MKRFDIDAKRYSYKDLRAAAMGSSATQEDIDLLGEWFTTFGNDYWNGEYFDADDGVQVWPVYGEPNEDGDFELIRYEIR